MKQSFNELMAIINDSKNWKAQHAAFGTHLAQKPTPEYLSEVASKMIPFLRECVENWETVQIGLEPQLAEIRNKQIEATAEKFVSYSEEQLLALMAAIRQKKGIIDPAA